MTEPTQAQIEAAVKEIAGRLDDYRSFGWMEGGITGIAKAALTAAAQVGEPKFQPNSVCVMYDTCKKVGFCFDNCADGKWKATPYTDFLHKLHIDLHLAYEQLEATTIERCARKVESVGGDNAEYHAAAVRELKDAP